MLQYMFDCLSLFLPISLCLPLSVLPIFLPFCLYLYPPLSLSLCQDLQSKPGLDSEILSNLKFQDSGMYNIHKKKQRTFISTAWKTVTFAPIGVCIYDEFKWQRHKIKSFDIDVEAFKKKLVLLFQTREYSCANLYYAPIYYVADQILLEILFTYIGWGAIVRYQHNLCSDKFA